MTNRTQSADVLYDIKASKYEGITYHEPTGSIVIVNANANARDIEYVENELSGRGWKHTSTPNGSVWY